MRTRLCVLLAFCLCPLAHGETGEAERETHRAFRFASPVHVVPTMANSPGRFGAYFKTKVVIFNPTDFDFPIYATLYGPNGQIARIIIEIPFLTYITWDNFLEEEFGYRGAGAVEFDSWFEPPGGSDDYEFSVYAEVYTDSANGRYSTVVVDGDGADSIDVSGETRWTYNAGISSNQYQRVNVGLFNDSYSQKTFSVAVYDDQGDLAQEIIFDVPGKAWAQRAITARFESGFILWGCGQTTCQVYPWVVTVDNQSNDGQLTPPMVYDPPE